MSEASLRQALAAAILAAVIGVAALAIGAFVAPIPNQTSASQVVTALLIRGVLAIIGLGLALVIAYVLGSRIENASERAVATPLPKPDPSASSPLVTMFATPGPRRDATFGGAIVTGVYWLMTTLYILALGKVIGNLGVDTSNLGSFASQHIVQGLVLVAAGMGCGAIGARTAQARRLTQQALMRPGETALPPSIADAPPPTDPTFPQS